VASDPRQHDELWSFPMPHAEPSTPAWTHTTAAYPPVPPPPPVSTLPPPPPPPGGARPPSTPRGSLALRWRVALAAVLALALGATGIATVDLVRGGSDQVTLRAPAPASTVPATTIPSGSLNPTTPGNRPSTTQPAPSTTRAQPTGDRTVGLVNIATDYGGEGQGAGTGIVLSSDGKILTNHHVIEDATRIRVTVVATGKSYTASVLGSAPTKDVALLKLQGANGLAVAPLGDSSTVRIGDEVIGIGNAGGTGRPTESAGAVVGLGRTITATDASGGDAETLHNLIEVSAPLVPGQSGGPLYHLATGTVIGVDSAGSSGNFGGRSRFRSGAGAGFAIPINDALTIVQQIERGQESDTVVIGTPPMLGISATTATIGGALVNGVNGDTPADAIGLQTGDVITSIDGRTIRSVEDLTSLLRSLDAGDEVTVTWNRNGLTRSATATLVAGPAR
jgi:S1-C subfamily serine protease